MVAWIQERRDAAAAQFEKSGFPTTKMEDWRFANIDP